MAARPRSRSRSPLRTRGGIMGNERRGPPPRDRSGSNRNSNSLNQSSDKMVYLSNLPYEMTWMELKDIVREKAGEVNFVETLENREGKSKGCAVIEFKTRESAEKCVEVMHRTELRGRLIVVKEIRDPIAFFRKVREDTGVDFLGSRDRQAAGGRGRAPPSRSIPSAADNETYGLSPSFLDKLNIKTPLVNRIFITNISYNCGVGRLFDVCSLAGKVTWLDLQLDKEGKSKGMAVCQYSHPIEAVQAVSMLHDQRLFDRTLSVKMDRFDKDPSTERREGELPVGLRGIGMGLGADGAPLTDVASVISSISARSTVPHHMNGSGMLSSQLNSFGASVNPFPAALPAQPIQQPMPQPQLQSTAYVKPEYVVNDHPAGFHNPQSGYAPPSQQSQQTSQSYYNPPMQSAQPQQPIPQSNGPHFFNKPNPAPVPKAEYIVKPEYMANSGGGSRETGYGTSVSQISTQHTSMNSQNAYGGNAASGAYGSGHGYDSHGSSRVVLIKNLPIDYTWQIVSDRVQQFGDLESVEMISPGVAKVRFVQLQDAERVKTTLQGTTVEGRIIGTEYL